MTIKSLTMMITLLLFMSTGFAGEKASTRQNCTALSVILNDAQIEAGREFRARHYTGAVNELKKGLILARENSTGVLTTKTINRALEYLDVIMGAGQGKLDAAITAYAFGNKYIDDVLEYVIWHIEYPYWRDCRRGHCDTGYANAPASFISRQFKVFYDESIPSTQQHKQGMIQLNDWVVGIPGNGTRAYASASVDVFSAAMDTFLNHIIEDLSPEQSRWSSMYGCALDRFIRLRERISCCDFNGDFVTIAFFRVKNLVDRLSSTNCRGRCHSGCQTRHNHYSDEYDYYDSAYQCRHGCGLNHDHYFYDTHTHYCNRDCRSDHKHYYYDEHYEPNSRHRRH